MKIVEKKLGPISYYQKGSNPVLLLMSGTHGDEYGVIEPLKKIVNQYSARLPDFIFIPEVSPTAVKKQTRRNQANHDVNRKFFENTDDLEAISVMRIVKKNKFKLGLSFHEDVEYDSFYIYDSEQMMEKMLNKFKKNIKKRGIGLYTGIDDVRDVQLGSMVHDGYLVDPAETNKLIIGDFWHWALINGLVTRLLYPEIPTVLSEKDKIYLTEIIFNDIIFPLMKTA